MSGNEDLVELSDHFPDWKGRLVQSAFDDLLRGIRKAQERLNGQRFLVVLFRREFDYDGLSEYIYLVAGCADLETAQALAEREIDNIEATFPREAQDASGKDQWHIVDEAITYPLIPTPVETIQPVYTRGIKLAKGWFDRTYDHWRILEIATAAVVDEALFRYLNCEDELIAYFLGANPSWGRLPEWS